MTPNLHGALIDAVRGATFPRTTKKYEISRQTLYARLSDALNILDDIDVLNTTPDDMHDKLADIGNNIELILADMTTEAD